MGRDPTGTRSAGLKLPLARSPGPLSGNVVQVGALLGCKLIVMMKSPAFTP